MVTLASTIEELDFEERLDLINVLWDSLASDPAAAGGVGGSRQAQPAASTAAAAMPTTAIVRRRGAGDPLRWGVA